MKYEKIHACRNDCCLFRKELSDVNVCPSCGMSRWKIPKTSKKEVKNVSVKVMWYFSPIPRFERMFRSKETSRLLTWHARKREVNDLLQHSKDALSWKKLDNLWSEFGLDLKIYVLLFPQMRNRPEGCMVENYIVEEAIEFCSEFIAGVSSIGLNSSVIKRDSNVDRPLSTSSFIRLSKKQLDQAHLYAIQNVNDVLLYVEQHMESLCKLNSDISRSNKWIQEEHNHSFSRWLSTRCDWVDNRSGVKVDELGFTIVDLKRIGHKSDSFILATQAKQVFYVQDSANPEWSVVLTSPQRTIEEDFFEDEIRDMLQECGYETIKRMPNVDTPNEIDDTTSTYSRHDCEGRWVEKGPFFADS
ncbi:hypothetical protein E5676_scaffold2277G00180 [Cucumis melo var. makuwa]|uniref:DUF4216 domain-containing protein n=1 Tax=Cucumis melo var. makuwa TaxID=1194695 RepID=A0A5D3E0Y6_CUCMM|nr:hypothetical protein E6C27_scaffold131G00170 [Cucumis melo var. makuwa]TYK29398.1 hypothetical protein E5676_scaffold2277G00180 [Cucumis melo var. makuwa]